MNPKVKKTKTFICTAFLAIFFFTLITCNPVIAGGGDDGGGTSESSTTAVPTFNIAEGYHTTDQNLVIDCQTPGAEIFYTLNPGSALATELPYTTPIPLTGPGIDYTIETYARVPGKTESARITKTFKITGKLIVGVDVLNPDEIATGGYPKLILLCTDRNGAPVDNANILYTEITDSSSGDSTPDHLTGEGTHFAYLDDSWALHLKEGHIVKAIAYKEGWETSDLELYDTPLKAPAPVFDPVNGTIVEPGINGTAISIFCSLKDAEITYQTIDYSETAFTSAPVSDYKGAFKVDKPSRVRAIAKKGTIWETSEPTIVMYKMKLPAPTFNPTPAADTFYTSAQTVTLNCDKTIPNLKIRYQKNSGPVQVVNPGDSIEISDTTTVTAYSFIQGDESGDIGGWTISEPTETTYRFQLDKPVVDPPGGDFYAILDGLSKVKIIFNPADLDVYYDLTSDTAAVITKTNGTQYTAPFTLDPSTVYDGEHGGTIYLRVRAYKKGSDTTFIDLDDSEFNFKLSNPKIYGNAASYDPINVRVTHPMQSEGVILKYTKNPTSVPDTKVDYDATTDRYDYIVVDKTTSLKVAAEKKGWKNSDPVSKTFTLKPYNPAFYVEGTSISTGGSHNTNINLEAYDKNVIASTIYYTDDGTSDPTNPLHPRKTCVDGQVIPIRKSTTIRAASYIEDWGYSDVIVNDYQLIAKKPRLVVTGSGLDYTCTIYSDTTGANVYFSLDGRDPVQYGEVCTPGGTGYVVPLLGSSKIRAIATKTGWTDSLEASLNQSVNLPIPEIVKDRVVANGDFVNHYQVVDGASGNTTNTYTYLLDDAPLGHYTIDYKDPDTGTFYPGIDIRYTTNGVDPSSDIGFEYRLRIPEQVNITTPNATFKSIAYDSRMPKQYDNSPVNTTIFKFKVRQPTFAAPYTNPEGGTGINESGISDAAGRIFTGTSLTVNCATVDSTVHYTITDASGTVLPVSGSAVVSGGSIVINNLPMISKFKVSLVAKRDSWVDSEVEEAVFYRRLNMPEISCPILDAGNSTATSATIEIVDDNTQDVTIYYTNNSSGYSSIVGESHNINFSQTTTVKAYVRDRAGQWLDSETTLDKTYTKCAVPTFNLPSNHQFLGEGKITLSSSDSIQFKRGSEPWKNYTGDITVAGETTFQARALRSGYLMSDASPVHTYTTKMRQVQLSKTSGLYDAGDKIRVTLTSENGGTIEYFIRTSKGTSRRTASSGDEVVINAVRDTEIINATASRTGWVDSDPVSSGTYRVRLVIPSGLVTDGGTYITIYRPGAYPALDPNTRVHYRISYRDTGVGAYTYYGDGSFTEKPVSGAAFRVLTSAGVNDANNICMGNVSTSPTLNVRIEVYLTNPANNAGTQSATSYYYISK